MRTRFFIVHNPNAGQGTRRLYDAVLSRLESAGSRIEVAETKRHGEGMAAAAAAARSGRFDAILAAGGDGTVHDVAEGTLDHATPLGIVPVGTANVFAREIGLPRSPEALAETLLRGSAREIPLGDANGRPFLFVVGAGFDAEAVRQFEARGSRRLGRVGLVEPVMRALIAHRDRSLRVAIDESTVEAQWILVTRTKRYAAGLMLAPGADLTEPLFHVLSMKGSGRIIRIAQLSALAMGYLRFGHGVTLMAANRIRIEGDPNVPVQIDGEAIGHLPLDIKIHSRPLRIILPQMSVAARAAAGAEAIRSVP